MRSSQLYRGVVLKLLEGITTRLRRPIGRQSPAHLPDESVRNLQLVSSNFFSLTCIWWWSSWSLSEKKHQLVLKLLLTRSFYGNARNLIDRYVHEYFLFYGKSEVPHKVEMTCLLSGLSVIEQISYQYTVHSLLLYALYDILIVFTGVN